jgi:hypothetical protein
LCFGFGGAIQEPHFKSSNICDAFCCVAVLIFAPNFCPAKTALIA